jgi:hypothetical protein
MKTSLKFFLFALVLSGTFIGGGRAEAKSIAALVAPSNLNLLYCFTNGRDLPACPYIQYQVGNNWNIGLENPNVTITYNATLNNTSSGQSINDGDSVPVGTQVTIAPVAHVSNDIFWFGTGYTQDSPYGTWGTSPPALTCNPIDFVGRIFFKQSYYNIYAPLIVTPPTQTITTSSNLSCGGVQANGSEICTIVAGGPATATVNYGATSGTFYYRYMALPGSTCTSNDIPMEEEVSFFQGVYYVNATPYSLPVPATPVSFSFTAVSNNNPPVAPTVTKPGSCTTTVPGTYSFSATDPDGDTIRYGVDWNNDGIVDEWVPATGYVTSGTSQPKTHIFSTVGTNSFQVLTQDSNGANSGWTGSSISCAAPVQPPIAVLTASPGSITAGGSSTLAYTCTNGTTATISGVGTVTPAAGGPTNVSPVTTTTYTLTCTNSAGTDTNAATVTVGPAIPGTPTGLSAACNVAGTAVSLNWSPTPGATGYYPRVPVANASECPSGWQLYTDGTTCYPNPDSWTQTSVTNFPVVPGRTYNWWVHAGNSSGVNWPSPGYGTFTCAAPAPTTCAFSASPATAPSTLTWSSNGTSCTGSGFSTGAGSPANGKAVVSTNGNYTLTCTGAGGVCTQGILVGAACLNPTATITASVARVHPGATTVITYNATGVSGSCTVSGPGAPGVVTSNACVVNNSFTTLPITAQTTYTITCGAASNSVTINVLPKFKEF